MPETPPPGPRDADAREYCAICGCMLEVESCWYCLGDQGFHECGEDTCACLDPDEVTEICEECQGEGCYLVCPNARQHPSQEEPHA